MYVQYVQLNTGKRKKKEKSIYSAVRPHFQWDCHGLSFYLPAFFCLWCTRFHGGLRRERLVTQHKQQHFRSLLLSLQTQPVCALGFAFQPLYLAVVVGLGKTRYSLRF